MPAPTISIRSRSSRSHASASNCRSLLELSEQTASSSSAPGRLPNGGGRVRLKFFDPLHEGLLESSDLGGCGPRSFSRQALDGREPSRDARSQLLQVVHQRAGAGACLGRSRPDLRIDGTVAGTSLQRVFDHL